MASDEQQRSLQVQIVDPDEVSSLIQLENSHNRVPRPEQRPPSAHTQPIKAVPDSVPGAGSGSYASVPDPRRTSSASPVVPDPPRPRSASGAAPTATDFFDNRGPRVALTPPSGTPAPRDATGVADVVMDASADVVRAERLVARRIAVQLDAAIRRANAHTVLITSPQSGAGKSRFARLVAPHLNVIAPDRYMILGGPELREYDPGRRPDGLVVLVDGPSMLDGDGVLAIPQAWMHAFDASVIVVMGRATRSEALEDTAEWLRNANVPPIGVLYNEFVAPAPMERIRGWGRYLRGGTVTSDLVRALFTGGRASEDRT